MFNSAEACERWLTDAKGSEIKESFDSNGYLALHSLLEESEIGPYKDFCDKLLKGEIDASRHRHDLGSHVPAVNGVENITQIMWPSTYCSDIRDGPMHKRTEALAKLVLGEDMCFDFDMLMSKPPHSLVATPWHQDESYWLDMPDKRAVTFWVPLQPATIDNGCMWFVRGSHKLPLRTHRKVQDGHHTNVCDCSEEEGMAVPIPAGGCTGHHGRTLHYSRGNSTNVPRLAYIINYRPAAMVEFERERQSDHGLLGLANIKSVGQTRVQQGFN